MLNNKTCLIFDFDGVIANTDLGRFKVLDTILQEYDIDLSKSFVPKDLLGLSTKSFLVKNFENLNQLEIDKIIKKRHKIFISNLSKYCIPYEKMKESIVYFYSKYDLAIVTTNTIENVKIQLEYLGVINYFKWIIGREKSENENLLKTYHHILKSLNKEISECIVIEDSDIGVNAARNENFYCIRFDPENNFEKNSENEKVNSYSKLKDRIDKIRHANTQYKKLGI